MSVFLVHCKGCSCTFVSFSLGPPSCLIWIAGNSYVVWGERRAGVRPDGRQLGFSRSEALIRWLGVRGLKWGRLLSHIQFYASLDRPPDILVLHAGGNDLGCKTTRELLRDIKLDCLRLWDAYPGIILVWSDIVARRVYRHARSPRGINKARAKLNRAVGKFIARNGGIVVRHKDLEEVDEDLMWEDGIHLNHIGYDIWMLALQGGIERALGVWRDEHE